jgi:catalase
LLQGRNFSYLDTQLKRLGSPNFTQIPINAPRGCPVHTYQQDGHMQRSNRGGRVNYEPNGWGVGPREDPLRGYVSFAQPVDGPKVQLRPDSFADHYSQARQFYMSQTLTEQGHIQKALIFELSKCRERDIRVRMVAHLCNIDSDLAEAVSHGLGETRMPQPAIAARPTRTDLAPSPALSIQRKASSSFAGRVLGVLCSDGASGTILGRLAAVALAESARIKLISPTIHGVVDDGGILHPADEILSGGKSVLFDAVAIVLGPSEAAVIAQHPAAQDFVRDAHAHCKFVAFHGADALIGASGLADKMDDGYVDLAQAEDIDAFFQACRTLRHWPRETRLLG